MDLFKRQLQTRQYKMNYLDEYYLLLLLDFIIFFTEVKYLIEI